MIYFITGTGTGSGKTVLTAMLLAHLRGLGCDALAMKPFCSGSRADARLLHSLQKERVGLEEINPFYFDKPLAPAAAAKGRPGVPLEAVVGKIQALAAACQVLLVEGVGGVMVPLGGDYTVRDLIARLRCRTIMACRNRLGVINHALLTVDALQHVGTEELKIVMMGVGRPDVSAQTNPEMIRQRVRGSPVFCVPVPGKRGLNCRAGKNKCKIFAKNACTGSGR